MRRPSLLAAALLAAAGCAELDRGDIDVAELYAVGDSVFEWNLDEGRSAPEAVGQELGRPVYNAAISGALFTTSEGEAIPDQYVDGDWGWVILEGGGNDLNDLCGCGECGDVLGAIERELNAFVSSLRSAGRGVVIWSYYGVPSDAEFGFDRCGAALADLSALQAAAAEGDAGVLWVDGADAISASDDYAFDEDRVHPSAEGSAVIGAQIAEAIRGAESAR